MLEKVAADYADKGVVLAKINVDEEQFIAAQFQVRSIPTVYALFQGQPVADLTNARSEGAAQGHARPAARQAAGAAGRRGAGAGHRAAAGDGRGGAGGRRWRAGGGIFAQIVEMAPDNRGGACRAGARAGRWRARSPRPRQRWPRCPKAWRAIPRSRAPRPRSNWLKDRPDDSELAALRAAAAERPADMEAQLAFADAAFAAGDRDGAAETLLAMIAADREWNEGAAKAKLLQIFEAVGLEDPWVAAQRRRLSPILFG